MSLFSVAYVAEDTLGEEQRIEFNEYHRVEE